ncbi:hypothetical protein M406DRAFT_101844 [Cryphonectria parasitica EP155]|uniref:Uncharacterized protein n=1 Tax=Cryphonectria parasitica (strain ATCC 38755 / EP155) TaxID=660469 RepID=A0A9P4Y5X9_CRYP1|nr:uncharacterized protein M406DRAFT_101844 [Cryphonectria parasitica EP155]KAF3766962.1 hypothetical protein M406DRAFT_101844 [Cryphonectria parasitica EP155]
MAARLTASFADHTNHGFLSGENQRRRTRERKREKRNTDGAVDFPYGNMMDGHAVHTATTDDSLHDWMQSRGFIRRPRSHTHTHTHNNPFCGPL